MFKKRETKKEPTILVPGTPEYILLDAEITDAMGLHLTQEQCIALSVSEAARHERYMKMMALECRAIKLKTVGLIGVAATYTAGAVSATGITMTSLFWKFPAEAAIYSAEGTGAMGLASGGLYAAAKFYTHQARQQGNPYSEIQDS